MDTAQKGGLLTQWSGVKFKVMTLAKMIDVNGIIGIKNMKDLIL